jgi:hypothetical protein
MNRLIDAAQRVVRNAYDTKKNSEVVISHDDFDELCAALESSPWIPITEPPMRNRWYLVGNFGDTGGPDEQYVIMWRGRWLWAGTFLRDVITHWRELPEPPK